MGEEDEGREGRWKGRRERGRMNERGRRREGEEERCGKAKMEKGAERNQDEYEKKNR